MELTGVNRIAVAALVCAFLVAPCSGEPLSQKDRERLIAHLEMTESWLKDEVKGLSPQQLSHRSSPDSWSVKDVVEHLAIAEPQYWKNFQDSLPGEVVAGRPEATDDGILWYGIDRTQRARTGEARVPKGQYETVADALNAVVKLRASLRSFAKGTQEDLRGKRLKGGNMDLYQWFLMISSHSQRHILQIREIKSHVGFPKS